jgi:hypothetical protein
MVDADGKFDAHGDYMVIRSGGQSKCHRIASNEVTFAGVDKMRELLATA